MSDADMNLMEKTIMLLGDPINEHTIRNEKDEDIFVAVHIEENIEYMDRKHKGLKI